MKRRLLITVLILLAFALASMLLTPRSPKPHLTIRITGLATNPSGLGEEWTVNLPKAMWPEPANAAWFWTFAFEQTNKASVRTSTPVPLINVVTKHGSIESWNPPEVPAGEAQTEILQHRVSWHTGNVYRVIGSYYAPGIFVSEIYTLSDHRFPGLRRFLPDRIPTTATSQWVEVTIPPSPSQLTNSPILPPPHGQ